MGSNLPLEFIFLAKVIASLWLPTAPHVIEHPRHTLEVVDFILYWAENAYIMMSNKVDWRSSVLKERKKIVAIVIRLKNYPT